MCFDTGMAMSRTLRPQTHGTFGKAITHIGHAEGGWLKSSWESESEWSVCAKTNGCLPDAYNLRLLTHRDLLPRLGNPSPCTVPEKYARVPSRLWQEW